MIIRLAELPILEDPKKCIQQAVQTAELLPKVDVLVLPELFTIGFDLDKIKNQAIKKANLEEHILGNVALQQGISIVGGTFPVATNKGIINMLPVWNKEGKLIHTTEKVHLFKHMKEDSVFVGGNSNRVFEIDGITAGASVCYDLRFPELFRKHALGGAKIIFLPAEWAESRIELFRSFLRARAGEAQVFFVGCNLGGDYLGGRFRGGGGIAAPDGTMVNYIKVNKYVRDFDIDIKEIDKVRKTINCLEDRRPETY